MGAVLAIAGMICAYPASGLAAFWHHLHHYFFPPKSLKSPHEKQNNEITRKLQGNSNDEISSSIGGTYLTNGRAEAKTFNSSSFGPMEWRKTILDNVMEVLADPNIHIIGVYGSNYEIKDGLLPKVQRRIDRDNLFDVVLSASVSKKPNMKSPRGDGRPIGFSF